MRQFDARRLAWRFMRYLRYAVRDRRYRPVPGVAAPPARLPASHGAAAAGLVDRVALESATYHRLERRADREGVHPHLAAFYLRFIKELKTRGIPMYFHSGLRSDEEQNVLFKKGVTKARAGQSPHNHGMAFDLVHWKRQWDLTPMEWAVIGAIGKEVARKMNLKIRWGGDWKFYDPAHWELMGWSDMIRNGA